MTSDPTTHEGRNELRRLIANTHAVWVPRDGDWIAGASRCITHLGEALDTLDAKDAEIARVNAQLAKLRDGIAEVVAPNGHWRHDSSAEPVKNYGPPASYGNYIRSPSPAGEKLAQLWKESDPSSNLQTPPPT